MVKCPECGAEEETAQHLVGHRQWKHDIHVCAECHVEVKSRLTLGEHTLAEHPLVETRGKGCLIFIICAIIFVLVTVIAFLWLLQGVFTGLGPDPGIDPGPFIPPNNGSLPM